MRKIIFKYLEHLLPIHNCIIIPDFGGFILNMEPAYFLSDGEIRPPRYSIVFNTELRHNDGILASHLTKDEKISYNAASKAIRDFVAAVKSDLKNNKTVLCGNLGALSLDEGKNIIYTQNKTVIYPANFGLYPTTLRQLSEVAKINVKNDRRHSLKYTAGSIAAAVAAIFLFITPVNIKDSGNKDPQKADFISTITGSLSEKNDNNVLAVDSVSDIKQADITSKEETKVTSGRTYYIIIGGEDNKKRADRLLEKIRTESFRNAEIIESQDRYRIYTSSFDDKVQAEAFLETFRKENPKFESAWLYSKRNN